MYALDKARKYGTGRTRREAEQNAIRNCAAYEATLTSQLDLGPPIPTLRAFAEEIVAKKKLAYKTRTRYVYFARSWGDPVLGNVGPASTALGDQNANLQFIFRSRHIGS